MIKTGVTDDDYVMRSIKAEAMLFGDIVQGSFIDSYRLMIVIVIWLQLWRLLTQEPVLQSNLGAPLDLELLSWGRSCSQIRRRLFRRPPFVKVSCPSFNIIISSKIILSELELSVDENGFLLACSVWDRGTMPVLRGSDGGECLWAFFALLYLCSCECLWVLLYLWVLFYFCEWLRVLILVAGIEATCQYSEDLIGVSTCEYFFPLYLCSCECVWVLLYFWVFFYFCECLRVFILVAGIRAPCQYSDDPMGVSACEWVLLHCFTCEYLLHCFTCEYLLHCFTCEYLLHYFTSEYLLHCFTCEYILQCVTCEYLLHCFTCEYLGTCE